MTKADKFFHHVWDCRIEDFCEVCRDLMIEAYGELPEVWQRIAREVWRKDRLKREADENVAYYAGTEEF